MDLLSGCVDIDLELAVVSADLHVLGGVANFDKIDVGILCKFFCHGAHKRDPGCGLPDAPFQLLFGHQAHGVRNHGRGKPEVDVGAIGAVFVDIDAEDTFMEGVNACDSHSARKTESNFREERVGSPSSRRGATRFFPCRITSP